VLAPAAPPVGSFLTAGDNVAVLVLLSLSLTRIGTAVRDPGNYHGRIGERKEGKEKGRGEGRQWKWKWERERRGDGGRGHLHAQPPPPQHQQT